MLDLRPEIDIGQPLKFADQLPALAVGDVLGKQKTVDQQPQLAVIEFMLHVPVRVDDLLLTVLSVANGLAVGQRIPEVDQICEIALDRLTVRLHAVFGFEQLQNVPLRQPMLSIGIAFQDVQNVQDQELFGLFCVHDAPRFILMLINDLLRLILCMISGISTVMV